MILKRNSISARLYRWFYGTEDMPDSLCPYFWKLFLMWVFIIPMAIISIPMIIVQLCQYKKIKSDVSIGERLGMFIMLLFALFLLFTLVLPFFAFFYEIKNKDLLQFAGGGIFLWCVIIGIAISRFISYLINRRKQRRLYGTKHQSIVKEFVKAKYNKYCPKITWK